MGTDSKTNFDDSFANTFQEETHVTKMGSWGRNIVRCGGAEAAKVGSCDVVKFPRITL